MYDIIIIGAGVVGSSIARLLSQYKLKILVLEKENDVAASTSGANSAILHSGYDPEPNSLKARLNVEGNKMFDELCKELDIEMIRNGSLTIARNDEEVAVLEELLRRAKLNNVDARIIDKSETITIEPNITKDVVCALHAKTAGIINPFDLCVGLMENAIDNGVELLLNSRVSKIKFNKNYEVYANDILYKGLNVINCAGLYSDEVNSMVNEAYFTIKPRRGEYLVLDHFDDQFVKHVIFTVPTSKGKGVLITPTTAFNYLIGPSSNFVENKDDVSTSKDILEDVMGKADKIIDNIPYKHIVKQFSGNRAVSNTNDFIIDQPKKGFINVAGIQSPGLVASPAIALEVLKLVEDNFKLVKKENYNPYRRKVVRFNLLSKEEQINLINNNKEYGNIVCRCEKVTEAEIRDSIRRSCGARSVKGVKIRTRAGFGKCQGGFCQSRVIKILSEELNIDQSLVDYDKKNSPVMKKLDK